jgi:hypothetical protein
MARYVIRKPNEAEISDKYLLQISNRLEALENSVISGKQIGL